jgi:hypothetical protein
MAAHDEAEGGVCCGDVVVEVRSVEAKGHHAEGVGVTPLPLGRGGLGSEDGGGGGVARGRGAAGAKETPSSAQAGSDTACATEGGAFRRAARGRWRPCAGGVWSNRVCAFGQANGHAHVRRVRRREMKCASGWRRAERSSAKRPAGPKVEERLKEGVGNLRLRRQPCRTPRMGWTHCAPEGRRAGLRRKLGRGPMTRRRGGAAGGIGGVVQIRSEGCNEFGKSIPCAGGGAPRSRSAAQS